MSTDDNEYNEPPYNFYDDELGPWNTFNIVRKSTSWYKLLGLPYSFVQYRNILRNSSTVREVEDRHYTKHNDSWIFHLFEPRKKSIIGRLKGKYRL